MASRTLVQDSQQSVLQKQAIEEAKSAYSRLPHGDAVLRRSLEGRETLAEVLRTVEQKCQSHKRKKSTKCLEKLQKHTVWLQNISSVVDVAVQTQAGIGCPLWAPIKFVLKVSDDNSKATEQVSNLLVSIVECLPRLEIYEKLQSDDRLQVALLNVFVDVVDFSVRAYRFFRRGTLARLTRTVVHSFDQDIGAAISQLERRARAADQTAVATELLAAAEFRRKTGQRQREELKAECESWLKPSNVKHVHLHQVRTKLEGTCNWITSNDEYERWLNLNLTTIKDRLLTISGSPGCGKSVLASSIVVRLENDDQQVLYFTFSNSDVSRQTFENLVRTLLWQTLLMDTDKDNIDLVHRLRINGQYTVMDLWEAFISVVSSFAKPVFCVLDGIDECTDFNHKVAMNIVNAQVACQNLRILILGRRLAIEPHLGNLESGTINITSTMIDQDIEAFIGAEISKSDVLLLPELHQNVYEKLKEKSDGMFLYVRLMIDDLTLRKSCSRFEINERLQALPRGLENAYQLVFLHILQKLDKLELRLAQSLLTFIIGSCRPLHIEEFRYAYALHCRSLERVERPIEEFLLIQPPQNVLSCLGGLVSMTDGVLRLSHSSVKDFLVRPENQWLREPDQAVSDFKIDLAKAHRSFFWLCLDFIKIAKKEKPMALSPDIFQCLPLLQDSYPFLEYATLYAFYHLNRAGPPCPTTLAKIEDVLGSAQSIMWLENFARLQFQDLRFYSQLNEFLAFAEQMTDLGLDTRYLAIFDRTLKQLRSQEQSSERAERGNVSHTEQVAMFLELATNGQFGNHDQDQNPDEETTTPHHEPDSAALGAQTQRSKSGSEDASILVSRISNLLKGQTPLSIAHQIELYIKLHVSLQKIRVLVDPLKLLFQLILRKASSIPVYALVAIGEFYERCGKFQEALEVYTAASKKVDHLDVPIKSAIYTAMGFCYGDLYQYAEASEAYKTAFTVGSVVFGRRHRSTLLSLYRAICAGDKLLLPQEMSRLCDILCLGQDFVPELSIEENMDLQRVRKFCYQRVGEHDRAARMRGCLQTTLEQYRGSCCKDDEKDPDIAYKIGRACLAMDDCEAALDAFRLAFEAHKGLKGTDAYDTIASQSNICSTLYRLERYDELAELCKDLYPRERNLFGPDNVFTLNTRDYFAGACEHLGKYNEAESLYKDLLARQRSVLGPNHITALATQDRLARTYGHLGEYSQAESLYEDLLARRRSLLGRDHQSTFNTQECLARTYGHLGEYSQAESLYEDLLARRRSLLGRDHQSTFNTQECLARTCEYLGKFNEAESLYNDLLSRRTSLLGPDNEITLDTQWYLANVCEHLGKTNEAIALYTDLLPKQRHLFGPDHRYTGGTEERLDNFVTLYQAPRLAYPFADYQPPAL